MSLLLRTDSAGSSPISAFGLAVPRRLVRWFASLWISAVLVGSLLPVSAKVALHASESNGPHSKNTITMKHRFIHFIAFGSSFLVLSLLATGRREQLKAAVEIMTVGCIVEIIQFFVYSHRQVFEWWDVRDDAIGIVVGFLLLQIASRVKLAVVSRS
jgi:hypothetical protein